MLHCYVYSTINKSSMSMSKVKGSLTRVNYPKLYSRAHILSYECCSLLLRDLDCSIT